MANITQFPIPTKILDPADYPEFVGPQGEQGIQGIQGIQGPAGDVSSPDDSVQTIVTLTQAQYDALDPKVADRLYLIVG